MYKSQIVECQMTGVLIEHIFCDFGNGVVMSFPNIETNVGNERQAYLAWLAEGNTPEPWNPETLNEGDE